MRSHSKEPLLEVGYFGEERLEPSAGEAAKFGGYQCFRAIGVSLVMDQSEKVPSKKKSGNLPPAIAKELVDLHCARSDVEDVFRAVGLVEYRAMRLDIEGAHNGSEAGLFLACQRGTRRELARSACIARSDEVQRMSIGSSSHAEPRHRFSRLVAACRAMHRITLAAGASLG